MSTAIAEEKKTGTKLNQLEQLKKFTKVVADTADFESMKEFKPQDATTNPSLVYAATQKQQYAHLIEEVLADRKKSELSGHEQIEDICDHLLVQFGCDILEIVPGRVSTETDARLSFDVEGSIKKARTLIKLYEERKIPRERVLIKIASTWEGLLAAEQLQKEGIRCNLTLMFSLPQAVRAGEAKVQLKRRDELHLRLFRRLCARERRRCSSSRRLSGGFTIGTKKRTSAITPARKIQVFSRLLRFIRITRSSISRPKSWVRASATSAKSANWRAVI